MADAPSGHVPSSSTASLRVAAAKPPARNARRIPGADFTLESLEGRDPPNNFEMLYDMAAGAAATAFDDYSQISFATADARSIGRFDLVEQTDASAPTLVAAAGGELTAPAPAPLPGAVDLLVGLEAGTVNLDFVVGISGFDFGAPPFGTLRDGKLNAVQAGSVSDDASAIDTASLDGATIALANLLPAFGDDSIGGGGTAAADAPLQDPYAGFEDYEEDGGATGDETLGGDKSSDYGGSRYIPPAYSMYSSAGNSLFGHATDNLSARFARGLSSLTSRFNAETSGYSTALSAGLSKASSHFANHYGPTALTESPYDTAASSAAAHYGSMASRLDAQLNSFTSAASASVASASSAAADRFDAAVDAASARYQTARSSASDSFTDLMAAHTLEPLYTSHASAAFYGTVLPAADFLSSSALTAAYDQFTDVVTSVATNYVSAISVATGHYASALAAGTSLFTEMTSAGNAADDSARAAASIAFGKASTAVSAAQTDLLSRAGAALSGAGAYAWTLYDGAIDKAQTAFEGGLSFADQAATASDQLSSHIATLALSATPLGSPSARGDVEAIAESIDTDASDFRAALDDAISDAATGALTNMASNAGAAAGAVESAYDNRVDDISDSAGAVSNAHTSADSSATSLMSSYWTDRAGDIDAWRTGTLDPYSATSLGSSSAAISSGLAAVSGASSTAYSAFTGHRSGLTGGTTGAGTGPGSFPGWSAPSTVGVDWTSGTLATMQNLIVDWLPGLKTRVGVDPSQWFVARPDATDLQMFFVGADFPAGLTSAEFAYQVADTRSGVTPNGDDFSVDQTVHVYLERNVAAGAFDIRALYLIADVSYVESQTFTHTEVESFWENGASVSRSATVFETVTFGAQGSYWFDMTASGTLGASVTLDGFHLDERRSLSFTLERIGESTEEWSATRAASQERDGYVQSGEAERDWTAVESGAYRQWNLLTGSGAVGSSFNAGLTATLNQAELTGAYERGIWVQSTRPSASNVVSEQRADTVTASRLWTHASTAALPAGTSDVAKVVETHSSSSQRTHAGDANVRYLNFGSYVMTAVTFEGPFDFADVTASKPSAATNTASFDSIGHATDVVSEGFTAARWDYARRNETAAFQRATVAYNSTVNPTNAAENVIAHSVVGTASATATATDIAHSHAEFDFDRRAFAIDGAFAMVSQGEAEADGSYFHDAWQTQTVGQTATGTRSFQATEHLEQTRPAAASLWEADFHAVASVFTSSTATHSESAWAAATRSAFDRAALAGEATRVLIGNDLRLERQAPTLSNGTRYSTETFSGGELFGARVATGSTKQQLDFGQSGSVAYSNDYETVDYQRSGTHFASQSESATASESWSGVAYAKQLYESTLDDVALGVAAPESPDGEFLSNGQEGVLALSGFYNAAALEASVGHAESAQGTSSQSLTKTSNYTAADVATLSGAYYQMWSSAAQSQSHSGTHGYSAVENAVWQNVDFGSDSYAQRFDVVNDRDPYLVTEEMAIGQSTRNPISESATPSSYRTLASDVVATRTQRQEGLDYLTASSTFSQIEKLPDRQRTAGGAVLLTRTAALNYYLPGSEGGGEEGGPPYVNPQSQSFVRRTTAVDTLGDGAQSAWALDRFAGAVGTGQQSGVWRGEDSASATPIVNFDSPGAAVVGAANVTSETYSEVGQGFGVEPYSYSNNFKNHLSTLGHRVVATQTSSFAALGSYVLTQTGRAVEARDDFGVAVEHATETASDWQRIGHAVSDSLFVKSTNTAIASASATATATPAIPASSSAAESTATATASYTRVATETLANTAYNVASATGSAAVLGQSLDFATQTAADAGFDWANYAATVTETSHHTEYFTSHDIATPGWQSGTVSAKSTNVATASALDLVRAAGADRYVGLDDDGYVQRSIRDGSAVDWASETNSFTRSATTSGTWSLARSEKIRATFTETGRDYRLDGGYVTGSATAYAADVDRGFAVDFGRDESTDAYVRRGSYSGTNTLTNSMTTSVTTVTGVATTYSVSGGTMTEPSLTFTNLSENLSATWSQAYSDAARRTHTASYDVAAFENASLARVAYDHASVTSSVVEGQTHYADLPGSTRMHSQGGFSRQTHTFRQSGSYTTSSTDFPYAGQLTRQLTTQFSQTVHAFGSVVAAAGVVQLGNMALGRAARTADTTVGDLRSGTTALTVNETGSFTRSLTGETQSGSFHVGDVQSHGFVYRGLGVYKSTAVSGLLGGRADAASQVDEATLSAAGARTGGGVRTFRADGSFSIPSLSLGTVGTMTLATTSASATGLVTVSDSATFGYSEANFDVALAADAVDYFYGNFDAADRSATATALQAFGYSRSGTALYAKDGSIAGSGVAGSFTLAETDAYDETSLQFRADADATRAVRLDGEHLTTAAHAATGSLLHQLGNSHGHSYSAAASYTVTGAAGPVVATMSLLQTGAVDYSLTDAYGYRETAGRAEDRSWSSASPATTGSFVVRDQGKDQSGILWQSENAAYAFTLAASWTTAGTAPSAAGNPILGYPDGGDAFNFDSWGPDGGPAGDMLGGVSGGPDVRRASDYSGWLDEQTSGNAVSGSYQAVETYDRSERHDLYSTYDSASNSFGFEDATPTAITALYDGYVASAVNVDRQQMNDVAEAVAPHSYSHESQAWQDAELATATQYQTGFSIGGLSGTTSGTVTEMIPTAISQTFSVNAVPDASYYVTARVAVTEGDAVTSLTANYTTGEATLSTSANRILNGAVASLYYGDAAAYDRLDVSFDGILAGTRNDESISHIMNNTAYEGAANEWNVVVTRTEGDQTVLATYTGSATDGVMTVSDYYREVERTDIVIPEGEVDIHWTRTRQSGIYYTDDRASFDQSQGWDGAGGSGDDDQGFRDGYGDHGSFGGAAIADDVGLYNGLDFGSDGLLDTLVEYGRKGPLSFTVAWSTSSTEEGIGFYSPIVPDYYDPSIVDPDADASVGYTNTSSYSAMLWATARANEPGRVHRSYSTDTDDVVTTHYSRSGTGSYLQSYVLKSIYDERHSGTTGSWVEADVLYDGYLFDTGSKSSSNRESRTASNLWSNSGTRSYSRSYAEIDGELQPGSVYQWRDGGKVLRSQSQLASNTGSSALHTSRDFDYYTGSSPSDYSSFSGSFNATTTASTSVKAIFDSTRGYTWASSDTSPVWTDSGTHVRSFSGSAREADWDDGKESQTFSDGNGDWATYSATGSATHTTGHNYSTAGGSYREVVVSMTSWTSAWNGMYYDHFIPDYFPDVGDDGDDTTHAPETIPTSLALVFDSPPIPGGSENPLYDAGPVPDVNANLDFLADNPRLTEALSAIGGILKDLIALKGPDQGSEFDGLADASKIDRAPSTVRETIGDNPQETNANLQNNAIAAETDNPKTGSQAQKKNPYVANDRIDTLTGPNDGNANAQYLDLGLNSGNANNVHLIGDGPKGKPAAPQSGLRKRDQLLREQGGPNEHDAVKDRRAFAASASEFLSFADVLAPAFVTWLYFELLPALVTEKVVFEYAEGLVIRIGAKAVKVTGSALRGLADKLKVPTRKIYGWFKRSDKEIVEDIVKRSREQDALADALTKAKQADKIDDATQGRPSQLHHYATNKSRTYTPKMKAIADRYGLNLDEAWNKQLLPHLGRHPNQYHEFVQRNMERAAREAGGDKEKFLELFEKYVKGPVRQNPDLLRKTGWE